MLARDDDRGVEVFVLRRTSRAAFGAGMYVFPGGKWEISAWVKNLTDEDIVIYGQDFWFAFYDANALAANPDITVIASQPRYAPPRTYGVTLKYSFF